MIDAFERLNNFGWGNIVMIFLLFITGAVALLKAIDYICDRFGIETKQTLKEKERDEKIATLERQILELQDSAKKFNEDRVNDRAQSFNYQNEYMDIVNSLNEKQDKMLEQIKDLAEQNRKYQLADTRETLLQAYRYYTNASINTKLSWTELEKHAFNEQYDVYISNGGNSYIQTVVRPAMDKLHVVYLNDYDGIAELMASRVQHKE